MITVPVRRVAQPVGEIHYREIIHRRPGLLNAGQGVADIAWPWRGELRFKRRAEYVVQGCDKIKDRVLSTAGDVEDSASNGGRFGCTQVGRHDVGDAGEILRLQAIPLNSGPLPVQHSGDELKA